MHEYDKSSKYLIQHHGDSILRLAGIRDIESWKPLQAELVQHRRLPDGLIEVRHRDQDVADPYIIEIATFPEPRVADQVFDDIALFRLGSRILPEVVVLFLSPRGRRRCADSMVGRSRRGGTVCRVSWRIIKLWEVPADELLAGRDIGLVPWVPLARFAAPPERMIRRCRARIEEDAKPNEKENLLAVTQFLARLRYNDETLFQILGGRKAMIESPLLQELKEEWTREGEIRALLTFLTGRFGAKAESLEIELKSIDDEAHLRELVKHAAKCRNLAAFRKMLSP
jgi:hypothetical protein